MTLRRYNKCSTIPREALLDRLHTCPHCGRALPKEPELYTLERDGVPVVYCPTCGAEQEVPDA